MPADVAALAQHSGQPDNARDPIGIVLEIAGSGSAIALDLQRLQECSGDTDPSIALAGQVGSQVKIRVGKGWLLASVRTQRQDAKTPGGIMANIDFLGEGDEERLTGRIHSFRRGVTRYPIPGALIYPATSNDLRQIYASDGRTSIQVGTVFPTRDIRAGLYIDSMLGKQDRKST
ncbi:MAG: ATPase, partial [Sphingomonadales bacterium]|nr:ATPase [Sphingomonadales bacterium]